MKKIENRSRGLLICVFLVSGLLCGGCDRQDGRITQLAEEVAQLRQEVRHLRSLKADMEKLDMELGQRKAALKSTPTVESSTTATSLPGSEVADSTSNNQLLPAQEQDKAADSDPARARLGNDPVFQRTMEIGTSYFEDPYIGDKDAPVVVMAFIDFQSRASALFYKTIYTPMREEFAIRGMIRFIVRDFPLQSNKHSRQAAEIANCAGEQGKYWEVLSSFFGNPSIVENAQWEKTSTSIKDLDRAKLRRCIKANRYEKEIDADVSDALSLGIKGAPSFFIAKRNSDEKFEGTVVRGAQPYALIRKYIKAALK